jgi:hypothetical protein
LKAFFYYPEVNKNPKTTKPNPKIENEREESG